jgi:hypothetical protein
VPWVSLSCGAGSECVSRDLRCDMYGYDRKRAAAVSILTVPVALVLLPLVSFLGGELANHKPLFVKLTWY